MYLRSLSRRRMDSRSNSSIDEKVSYRRQIERQHSCTGRSCRIVKLITMQNLVVVFQLGARMSEVPKIWGTLGPRPLDVDVVTPRNILLRHM